MPENPDAGIQMLSMINGYQLSQAISTAAELRLPDCLADGPRSAAEVAPTLGVQADALHRLLRALSGAGVFHESMDGTFELTALGRTLLSDTPGSLRGWAEFVGRPYHRTAWSGLPQTIRTGETAFQQIFGTSVWDYRQQHPEESAIFDEAMSSLTGRMLPGLLDSFDFGRFHRIADLGGGKGALLSAILARYPGPQGVLFDLPHVVAHSQPVFEAAGVADRYEAIPGNIFESAPSNCDAYTLKSVIHDCTDEQSVQILRLGRAAMAPGALVLIIERQMPGPNEGAPVKLSDLNMMVSNGGRERTRVEYEALLTAAGLVLSAFHAVPGGWGVIEANVA